MGVESNTLPFALADRGDSFHATLLWKLKMRDDERHFYVRRVVEQRHLASSSPT